MWRRWLDGGRRLGARRRRIFIYEHCTGGGLLGDDFERLKPLAAEGLAMANAVTDDFRQLPDVRPVTLLDRRLAGKQANLTGVRLVTSSEQRDDLFDAEVRAADGVLLIAPETDGILAGLARRVEQLDGRLLSPSSEFCRWAADKSAVAATLAETAAMPRGVRLDAGDSWPIDFPTPAVLKPNDGCGSLQVRRLDDCSRDARPDRSTTWRLERYMPGEAASVLVLLGADDRAILCPFWQDLSDDGEFRYLGGTAPMPTEKEARVRSLVERVFGSMPRWRGYIGLDVVLGPADDGSQDFMIEVNPRITTSYVGVRTMYHNNLMQLMLDLLDGNSAELQPRIGALKFHADGIVDGCWFDKWSSSAI